MRLNFFNEPIFHPGDDFFAGWTSAFGDEPETPTARFIEPDEFDGFGCEITDESEHTAYTEKFVSEADLRAWLETQEIEIED